MIESNGPSKGHFYFVDFITTWAGKRLEKKWSLGGWGIFLPAGPLPPKGVARRAGGIKCQRSQRV